jgi:predicted Zn-ribbon and HTH transcriptional regulator
MTVIINKCTRCGHEWPQRGANKPTRCARCNSPYWDIPRGQPKGPKKIAEQ